METIIHSVDFEDYDDAVNLAVKHLKKSEIVAIPSETVYGLGANAYDDTAVAKIFAAKNRPNHNPLILHIHKNQLKYVVDIPEEQQKLVNDITEAFCPGPLTLVLPKTEQVSDLVSAGLDTVAVRIPAHPILRKIIKQLGAPIAAPSANKFQSISPTSAQAVFEELNGDIPLIIDDGACNNGVESTIISFDFSGAKPIINMLRPGPVSIKDLQAFAPVRKTFLKAAKEEQKVQAPGQFKVHYSPKTPLRLIHKFEDFEPQEGKRYGLLSYKGDDKKSYTDLYDWEQVETLSPSRGKLSEASVRLYFLLRKLDAAGLDEIIAEPVSETDIGVAIMDRLRKASINY